MNSQNRYRNNLNRSAAPSRLAHRGTVRSRSIDEAGLCVTPETLPRPLPPLELAAAEDQGRLEADPTCLYFVLSDVRRVHDGGGTERCRR